MSLLTKLKPLADRVLVKRLEAVTKTAGGLYLPDSAQKKESTGKVVAVGNGARDINGQIIPLSLQVGDQVLLSEYGGQPIELEGEEYSLFRESDILAKYE